MKSLQNLFVSRSARRWLGGALLLLLWTAGCGGGPGRLDRPLADQSLVRCLNAWKEGRPAAALADESPAIICVDDDWAAGAKLTGFEILHGSAVEDGFNVHVRVALQLQDDQGRDVAREVPYVVGTSPQITVFRDQ